MARTPTHSPTVTSAKPDDEADKTEKQAKAAPEKSDTDEEAPTPTQAELDEARLNVGRAFTYQTRDGQAE